MLRIRKLFKLTPAHSLQLKPLYNIYIHLKDHNKDINPKRSKVSLSYMNLKNRNPDQLPRQSSFSITLKARDQKILDQKIFDDYKQKILQARLDYEEEVEVDPLWGEDNSPVHYYKNLSSQQATSLSHSIKDEVADLKDELMAAFFNQSSEITNMEQVKDLNDLSRLALYYRKQKVTDRHLWYEIQTRIGTQFHKLSTQSLINLNYAVGQSPKQCTPEFHKIIRDLLIEDLETLTPKQMVHLFYANRLDKYRKIDDNLQLRILKRLVGAYPEFSIEEKINWLFLFTDSRRCIVRKESHDRFWNEIRDVGAQLMYQLNIFDATGKDQFKSIDSKTLKKFVYSLYRMRLIHVSYMVRYATERCQQLLNQNKLTVEDQSFLFFCLTEIQNGKGIENTQLLNQLHQNLLSNWASLPKVHQLRTLWTMANLGLYNEDSHELYRAIQMEADNTILGYFCRLQLLNSSEREWQVIHLLAELEQLPISYYQDYKRFYNYVKTTTDWNLEVIKEKLWNTQCYIDTLRFEASSLDKKVYNNLKKFLEFAQFKIPNDILMGVPIKNTEFADFAYPKYQISIDIATERDCIPGTQQFNADAQNKIKSLESLGWKHFYLFEKDIENLKPLELFDHLFNECQQYIQSQQEVIEAAQAYRSYELELIRNDRFWKQLQGEQIELWKNNPEHAEQILARQEDDQAQFREQEAIQKFQDQGFGDEYDGK